MCSKITKTLISCELLLPMHVAVFLVHRLVEIRNISISLISCVRNKLTFFIK